MAGLRDPRDTPAGRPRREPPPRGAGELVFAFAGDDAYPPRNVVIVRKGRGRQMVVRPAGGGAEFSVSRDHLTAPEGYRLP